MIRRHVFVSGRVQGVFFRDSCRRSAEQLGVNGWVRNLPDGRVEFVAEGEADQVEALVEWGKVGPDLAVVDELEVHVEEPVGLSGFAIR